ncbi:MAG: four helix bundle protein [Calditrichaeota bacterium]|nr:MAG: four helix bundle protein [Calditrichota bacterium]
MGYGPITHFSDIEAWKIGRKVRRQIYIITRQLPQEELYNLSSQMRRAAVSVTANIAEGYGRYHFQETIQFCRQSRGSLYELQDHLLTCLDEHYITDEEYQQNYLLIENCIKALNGYIRMLQRQREQQRREQGTGNRK